MRDRLVIMDHEGLAKALRPIVLRRSRAIVKSTRQKNYRRTQLFKRLRSSSPRPGSVRAVALSLGMSQPVLHRLLNPRPGIRVAVTRATVRRLTRLAGPEIKRFLLDNRALDRLDAHRSVLRREEGSFEAELGLAADERARLLRLVESDRRLVEALRRLKTALESKDHAPWRRLAAMRSALLPLNRHWTTFGIERGLTELSDEELRQFLLLGIRRELILLQRDSDPIRAQSSSVNDPVGEFELRWPDGESRLPEFSWDFMQAEGLASSAALAHDLPDPVDWEREAAYERSRHDRKTRDAEGQPSRTARWRSRDS